MINSRRKQRGGKINMKMAREGQTKKKLWVLQREGAFKGGNAGDVSASFSYFAIMILLVSLVRIYKLLFVAFNCF